MAALMPRNAERKSSSHLNPSSPVLHRPLTRASTAMAVALDTSSTMTADGRMLTPPPSSARTELAMQMDQISMNSPVVERGTRGYANEKENDHSGLRNGFAFSAQNRAILLSGLPQSPASKESQSPSPRLQPQHLHQQPQKCGNTPIPLHRHLTPLVTVSTATGTSQYQGQNQHLTSQHLQSGTGGNSPLQSPRIISPCVYVKAVGLRQRSNVVSPSVKDEEDRPAKESDDSSDAAAKTTPTATTLSDSRLSTPPPEGRLFVSARVVSANPEKKPFVLRREFDLQELIEAVPRPDHRRLSSVNILASPVLRSPMSTMSSLYTPTVLAGSPTPTSTPTTVGATGTKRSASDYAPASPHPSLRRHGRQQSQKELPSPDQFVARGGLPIPIRPHPSLGRLPGLAAIILSRRVEAGDMIEIPVPYPESWQQTISYVYKSHGDPTEQIRRNIEHLGGTCD